MSSGNPCVQCGACCAFFRVSFFWEETNPSDPEGVPPELTEPETDMIQCMKGTNQPHPRCIALDGKIGEKVACRIYSRRSTTCREFGLHKTEEGISADGIDLVRCNQARKAWNLPPLTRADLRSFSRYPAIRRAPFIRNSHILIARIPHKK